LEVCAWGEKTRVKNEIEEREEVSDSRGKSWTRGT